MEKIYKDHKITLNESDGKFAVMIDGMYKKFSSLKSAMNAVDGSAKTTFEPKDVLVVVSEGYDPTKYVVKEVRLVEYLEEKGYRRGSVTRYLKTDKGVKYRLGRWNGKAFYPVSSKARLTKICKELTEQSKISNDAQKRVRTLEKSLEVGTINLDPRPDA